MADRDACHPLSGASSCPTITASGASSKGRQHEAVPEKLQAHSSCLEAAQDVPGWAAQAVRVAETSRSNKKNALNASGKRKRRAPAARSSSTGPRGRARGARSQTTARCPPRSGRAVIPDLPQPLPEQVAAYRPRDPRGWPQSVRRQRHGDLVERLDPFGVPAQHVGAVGSGIGHGPAHQCGPIGAAPAHGGSVALTDEASLGHDPVACS